MTSLRYQQHLVELADQLIDWQDLYGSTHWIIKFSQTFHAEVESVLGLSNSWIFSGISKVLLSYISFLISLTKVLPCLGIKHCLLQKIV